MLLALKDRIVMDTLGDEVLVLDGDRGVVHRLTGPIAEYAVTLRDGTGRDGAAELADDEYTRALVDAGIAVTVSGEDESARTSGISRRSALGVLVGASAGAAMLLLPSSADAASVDAGSSETTTTLPQGPNFGSSPNYGTRLDTRYVEGSNPPVDDYREMQIRWGQTYSGDTVTSNPQAFNWTVSGSSPTVYLTGTVGPADNGTTGYFIVPLWANQQVLTVTLELIPATGYSSRTVVRTITGPANPNG